MAYLFAPHFQAVNASGLPLSGAKLYFTIVGGDETNGAQLITVYQDAGLVTPHANPVVADASGLFAPIWVNNATFKVVLKTSANVTVQTIDGISAPLVSASTVGFGNGTVLLPSITFASDLDTGFYRIGANNIGVAVNGAKVIDIATGSVSIAQNLLPVTSDGAALGSATKMWADLFLASGGVVNFNNGDMLITHGSDTLAVTGGALVVQDTASRTSQFGSASLQVKDAASFFRYNATAGTAFQMELVRAQGTAGSPAIVLNGDTLGYLQWEGYDGANNIRAGSIAVEVDGVPGINDMPGKMVFRTTSDGGFTPGARMSLNAVGFLNMSSGSLGRAAPVTKTANFTVADGENWLINNKSGSSCTVTLPAAATFPGREIMFKNLQAQTVISAGTDVVPLGTAVAGTAILSANAGRFCTLVSDGTNWVIMSGVV